MASSPTKFYLEDNFDSKQFLEQYFTVNPKTNLSADFLEFPMKNLTKTFSEGKIKGDTLIDLSVGPMVCHLLAACDYFKNIIVLKSRDRCITELKRWADSQTGLLDWGHAAKPYVDTEGKSYYTRNLKEIQIYEMLRQYLIPTSIVYLSEEEKVRSAAQHVMKIDLEKENIIEPKVLRPADAIISAGLLDVISKGFDNYMKYVRKFAKKVKPGGYFILIGDLDTTYYTVGKDKFHAMNYNEDLVEKALVGEGFVVDRSEVKKRTAVSDLTDYKDVLFMVAHKQM
ncbi:nicotinamide N-methyltransferase-like [Ranitomeya variabilis]|uniref:nicotinamide N-methyltransferase-like n=1 Tax=Ranitomeya variabilis TaxID=490064 RepID=UPI00405796F6